MRYRLLALAVPALAGLAGLTGALHPWSAPTAPSAATLPLPPNVPDPAAERTLDRAAAAMAPERVGCVETKLWQKVTLPGLSFEANGRYLMGPGRRFRLEMRTKQGAVEATRLAVSDGTTWWEARRVGSGAGEGVTKLDVARLLAALDGLGEPARLRAEFSQGPRFGGMAPLLRNLRERMSWVKIEDVGQGGKPRRRLTGVWKPDPAADGAWPAGLPRQCRLELDAATLWPARVEWWGPAADGAPNTLLAQVEFRDPVARPALTPQQCAREFTFDPGRAPVVDLTDSLKADYAARIGRQPPVVTAY